MHSMRQQKHIKSSKSAKATLSVLAAAAFSQVFSANASAAVGTTLPVEIIGQDIVSVEMPVVAEGEKSPFDFILDPQNLLYETNAMRYGGGTVEEGASLLFRNSTGAYNFSHYSDRLTVANRSTVPVTVTVSASISNLDGAVIAGSENFSGDETPGIYLALVDNEGNVQPLSANGETSLSWIMEAAPENTYTINSETQTYENVLYGNYDPLLFDTYSFGLTGACNPNADWKNLSCHPIITVVWHIDPILPEQDTGQIEPLDRTSDEQISSFDKILKNWGTNQANEKDVLWNNDLQSQPSEPEDVSNSKDGASKNNVGDIKDESTEDTTDGDTIDETADQTDSTADEIDGDITKNTAN